MRIAIDLQAVQHGAADPAASAALVQAVAPALARAGHHVLLVWHHAHAAGNDALRLALAPLLQRAPAPAAAIELHVLDSAPGADSWRLGAAARLRDTLLRDLRTDLIWTPGLFERSNGFAIVDSALPAVYSLATPPVLAGNHAAEQLQGLRQARLLLGADAATVAALRDTVPQTPVQLATDAAAVLSALTALLADPANTAASAAVADIAETAVTLPAADGARPRMAYLSPLPPQHSGIADYSVELLAQLDRYYDIELIVDGPLAPDLAARYPVRDLAWFERHGGQYQRVLYHFGNSPVHRHMFALLQRHPGIVVLHDFFLSNLLDTMERDGYQPQALQHALYASHGYGALQAAASAGRNAAVWTYPCNRQVLDHASGVIVHSDFSRRLAQQWYGGASGADWHTVPLLRGLPPGHDDTTARATARAALGLADDSYVVCSFGMMGVTKRNDLLLEAFLASALAADRRCQLVFVGKPDPDLYGHDLARRIASAGAAATIRITGFVTADQYASWLAAADTGVQLRSRTRGETSASVLDCLLYGLPTVVNAHGSNTDLPADVVVQLEDQCDSATLAAALDRLYRDRAGRAALAARARAYLAAHHAPAQVGPRFVAAIEALSAHNPDRHHAELLAALRRMPAAPAGALMDTAAAIAANRLPRAPRQLFIDISALVHADLKTGIQRVVRSIILDLIAAPPDGYRIEPVYSEGNNQPYRYARARTLRLLDLAPLALEDAPLELRAGDLFLGLDLFAPVTTQNRARLLDMRRRGVQVHFVVYDLLPVLQPAMFPAGADVHFRDYLDTIGQVADSVVCISRAVADELHDWLAARPTFAARAAPLPLAYFHLGADLDASAPSTGLPADAARVLAAIAARPSLLMVGTLEPRKGQAQALAAVELLWAQGVDVNLVLVGKQGWMVDALARQLEQHPERGQRLFWLQGVSDEMLEKLYGSCAALLAASLGEGFGLPLIEAAQHGLPIIARDLPVFKEVGGAHASYFSGVDAPALAAALHQWLQLHQAGQAPASKALPWLTWKQSTAQLLQVLAGQRPYRTVAISSNNASSDKVTS
jgi:glycosyltransferase involved in cell wall biosynthesis